jgi:nucleoid-associated protein EbfC
MFDMVKIMKQLGDMQKKMEAAQSELSSITVTGEAGGGLVRVSMSGRGELRGITIDETLMVPKDRELLEDLIVAATHDAKAKSDTAAQARMADVTAGLPIPPGMQIPGMKF